MLEKNKYPYFSIDHLKMGLIRSGNTDLTPEDDEALTKYLWPIICEIIKTAIENKQNLIVEGGYVPFDWRSDFGKKYLRSIRFICLAMTATYINDHFNDIQKYSNTIESRLYGLDCSIEELKADNGTYIEGCKKYEEHVTLIDKDYEQTIDALFDW